MIQSKRHLRDSLKFLIDQRRINAIAPPIKKLPFFYRLTPREIKNRIKFQNSGQQPVAQQVSENTSSSINTGAAAQK